MGFTITGITENKPTGKRFELIKHRNGQIGIIVHTDSGKTLIKAVAFDNNRESCYAEWRLEDCTLFDGEIILKN
jgi:hypothetical protein